MCGSKLTIPSALTVARSWSTRDSQLLAATHRRTQT